MNEIFFKSIEWDGTSCLLKGVDDKSKKIIEVLDLEEKYYKFEDRNLLIYNHPNILFFEYDFVESKEADFDFLIKKYSNKDYSSLRFFNESTYELTSLNHDLTETKNKYGNLIEGNNIITNGIVEDELLIPPTLFAEMKLIYASHIDRENPFNFLSELFSLFAIADKSKISIVDDKYLFTFTIYRENNDNHVIRVPWGNWGFFTNCAFFNCLEWILIKSEENIKLSTVIQVVRQYLGSLNNLDGITDVVASLDSILNRIIKNETKEYFEQQNKLKDEFINYMKMEIEARNTLMRSLLGLITTIGLAYYGTVIGIDNFQIMMEDDGIALIFIFSLIAIIFFAFTFFVSYKERKSYYSSLKDIYIKVFLFSEASFENVLKMPTLFKGQWLYWATLVIFTIFLVIMIYAYSNGWGTIISLWNHLEELWIQFLLIFIE